VAARMTMMRMRLSYYQIAAAPYSFPVYAIAAAIVLAVSSVGIRREGDTYRTYTQQRSAISDQRGACSLMRLQRLCLFHQLSPFVARMWISGGADVYWRRQWNTGLA